MLIQTLFFKKKSVSPDTLIIGILWKNFVLFHSKTLLLASILLWFSPDTLITYWHFVENFRSFLNKSFVASQLMHSFMILGNDEKCAVCFCQKAKMFGRTVLQIRKPGFPHKNCFGFFFGGRIVGTYTTN